MSLIRAAPRYKHLVQKPSFCAPCCVQMALWRRGHWVEQEEIGFEMGAAISPERHEMFHLNQRSLEQGELGVSFSSMEPKLNEFFGRRKLPLSAENVHASTIVNPVAFLAERLTRGEDVIVDLWLPKENDGHYVIVSSLDAVTGEVTLCDPYWQNRSFWSIHVRELFELMDERWDGKERGFTIISQRE